ncbi:MAG: hypothetical protein ACK482_17495 [Aphanizomenon sp.]
MGQGASVIASLQAALACSGKCDCCENLQNQINEINNKLNNFIPQSEKSGIIDAGAFKAQDLILPAIGIAITNAINPLSSQIEIIRGIADDAINIARGAATAAANAASAAASALSKIAGIALSIASILASIAALEVLGFRIDNIELGLDLLGNDVSRVWSSVTGIKNTAERAEDKANQALSKPGIKGDKGDTGATGERGLTGATGAKGEKGEFDMAELAGIGAVLSMIQGGLVGMKGDIEVIKNNVDLPKMKSAMVSATQEGLCQELQNGQCFPNGLNMWYQSSPLATIAQTASIVPVTAGVFALQGQVTALQGQVTALQIQNAQNNVTTLSTAAAVQRLTPIAIGTQNSINNQNNAITNLGSNINNQSTAITNFGSNINNQNNAITNVNNVINNQSTAITNLGNNINNQSTAINNFGNILNNQSTAISNIGGNVTVYGGIVSAMAANITIWIPLEVPVVACEFKNGKWSPKRNNVLIQAQTTPTGTEALTIFNAFEAKARIAEDTCNAKNNDSNISIAVPDMWLIRPEHHRPQVIYQFAEILNGKLGSPKYSIIVPHHKPNKPQSPLPEYKKGNWEYIYVLKDNSKITIHGINEGECTKMINAIKLLIIPEYLTGAYISKNSMIEPKQKLAEITVRNTRATYYKEGRKNGKPEWLVKF